MVYPELVWAEQICLTDVLVELMALGEPWDEWKGHVELLLDGAQPGQMMVLLDPVYWGESWHQRQGLAGAVFQDDSWDEKQGQQELLEMVHLGDAQGMEWVC